MPSKFPINFIRERYEKDEKYFTVYDKYTPNYNKANITAKFYSKYESNVDGEVDPVIYKNIIIAKDYGPKEKLAWPETINQWYGWFNTPFVELDKSDPRLYFPQKSSELTKHGLKLLQNKTSHKK